MSMQRPKNLQRRELNCDSTSAQGFWNQDGQLPYEGGQGVSDVDGQE
jgi:hypothetical protein